MPSVNPLPMVRRIFLSIMVLARRLILAMPFPMESIPADADDLNCSQMETASFASCSASNQSDAFILGSVPNVLVILSSLFLRSCLNHSSSLICSLKEVCAAPASLMLSDIPLTASRAALELSASIFTAPAPSLISVKVVSITPFGAKDPRSLHAGERSSRSGLVLTTSD